jgi:hypothetical protein
MLAARNAGLTMLSAFAAASWTSRSVMIHISVQTTDGYHLNRRQNENVNKSRLWMVGAQGIEPWTSPV